MKTALVIGLGRFGRHVAKKMTEMNYEVMAIDQIEECVQEVLPYVMNAQIGDSTDRQFMMTVGVRDFDICFVAIGDNFQNSMETTWLVKELGAPMVVSRASREVHARFLLRNGADEIVYPEKHMANWTAIRFSSSGICDFVELGQEYGIFELHMPDGWLYHTIGELDIRRKYNINILGIKREGVLDMNVTPELRFTENMTILVLGKQQVIQKYFHL